MNLLFPNGMEVDPGVFIVVEVLTLLVLPQLKWIFCTEPC